MSCIWTCFLKPISILRFGRALWKANVSLWYFGKQFVFFAPIFKSWWTYVYLIARTPISEIDEVIITTNYKKGLPIVTFLGCDSFFFKLFLLLCISGIRFNLNEGFRAVISWYYQQLFIVIYHLGQYINVGSLFSANCWLPYHHVLH